MNFLETASSPNDEVSISQVSTPFAGVRLQGTELTNHVPIFINGTSDFIIQGWPGDGTAGNPFLIEGLNITYDLGLVGIEIMNTDAYFIIRDCYIGQLSSELGIYLHDTAHGIIEHTTVISDEGGIRGSNANETTVSHTYSSSFAVALYYYDSDDCVSEFNYLYSTDSRGFAAEYSHNLRTEGNTIETEAPVWYAALVSMCNDTVSINDHGINGLSSYSILSCYNVAITDLILSSDQLGLRIDLTHGITVNGMHADGVSTGGATFVWRSSDVTIMNSYMSSSLGYGMTIRDSNYTVIDNCDIEDIESDIGIHLWNSLWSNVTNNFVNSTGVTSIYLENSNYTLIDGNNIANSGAHGIQLTNSINADIIDNEILNPTLYGIYSDTYSHEAVISGNHLTTPGQYAIFTYSENWTIEDNEITDCLTGLLIGNSPNAIIHRNDISMATQRGMQISSCADADIVNNTISGTGSEAMYLLNSPRPNIEGNVISDIHEGIEINNCINSTVIGNSVTGSIFIAIKIASTSGAFVADNTISNPDYLGLFSNGNLDCTFQDNTITNGGFFFETYQTLDQVNHTFSGNTVNGLPLYYGLSETGLALDGSVYGEIILVNCNDSSIAGGTFVDSGAVFQIFYSDEISINDVHGIDMSVGNLVHQTTNIELTDSTFEGYSMFVGVTFMKSDNVTVSNVNFTNVDDTSYASVLVEYTPHFDISASNFIRCADAVEIRYDGNFSVTDCYFEDLTGYAIDTNTANFGVIQDNVIVGAYFGIGVSGHHVIVENNEVRYTERGIWASGTNAHNATVRFNDLQSNTYGIYIEYCDDWVITNNTIMWNYDYGIFEGISVDSAQTSYNTFLLNGIGNAIDNGGTQFWDDGVDTGNWWHDYSGSGAYDIPGSAGSQDRYPMKFEATEPIINQPQDIEYAEGSEGNTITWWPFDDYLRDWVVTIDGASWNSGIWNFSNITVNVDGLAYGTHTLVITVWDVDVNSVTDTVSINVYDDTDPVISGPFDQVLFVDAADLTLDWEVSDLNPDGYIVSLNETEFDTGTWTSGILTIDFAGITVGVHIINVTIYDVDGNTAQDLVTVRVIDDNVSPTIDHPDDVSYIVGETGNVIVWTPQDSYPDAFSVTSNGSLVVSGNWAGSRITLGVDGLSVGRYEFTIIVYDGSGNSATDSVNVTVIPLVQGPEYPPVDWVLLIIIGSVIGAVIIVIVIIYYLKKKRPAS
ncbi:MAG: right-handed parallel beta-helix repeat-containing protein [Candidatus Thorarchaeota archaeon]